MSSVTGYDRLASSCQYIQLVPPQRIMDWLTFTAQIATVFSVIFAAVSIRSNTRISRKQWNIDTFNVYSERYQSVIDSFPDNAFYNRFDESKLPPRSPQLTIAIRKYLFVICNVHYLADQQYLDNSIWQVWNRGIERSLRSPLITREWLEIKPEFEYFESFTTFIDGIQQKDKL